MVSRSSSSLGVRLVKSPVSLFRIALLTLTVSFAFAAVANAQSHADNDDPRPAFDRFIAAFNALDWESFRACFAEGASLFNPDIPGAVSLHRLDGRPEIERSFRVVFGDSSRGSGHAGPHIVPEKVRIQRFDDTAILTFEFKRPNHSFGRRTVVLNHTPGGWLIVHIHASNANE